MGQEDIDGPAEGQKLSKSQLIRAPDQGTSANFYLSSSGKVAEIEGNTGPAKKNPNEGIGRNQILRSPGVFGWGPCRSPCACGSPLDQVNAGEGKSQTVFTAKSRNLRVRHAQDTETVRSKKENIRYAPGAVRTGTVGMERGGPTQITDEPHAAEVNNFYHEERIAGKLQENANAPLIRRGERLPLRSLGKISATILCKVNRPSSANALMGKNCRRFNPGSPTNGRRIQALGTHVRNQPA